MRLRIDKDPVANGKVAGAGVNGEGQFYKAGRRHRRQAAAVDRGYTARIKGKIIKLALILKKFRPSETLQRYRAG